jgi:hypothetical protein
VSQFDQQWAAVIWARAADADIVAVLEVINELTASTKVNQAAVMVACAQILAQSITRAPLDVAGEVRAGILSLIDGLAMQSATEEHFGE